MKLVLDTNVLIAAFIAHGTCSELFEGIEIVTPSGFWKFEAEA